MKRATSWHSSWLISSTMAAVLLTLPGTPTAASAPADHAPDCFVLRCVALTFDDGPTQYTPSILRLLEKHHATATFFVIGPHALQHPTTVLREQRDGDAIGDHTVTHPHLTAVSSARVRFELDRAAHDIASVTGHRPTLLRPPFGAYDSRTRALAGQSGLAVVMWSLDPQDWRHISPATIDRRLLNHVRAGDIVSLHDRYARTLTALPRILTGLASRGFAFVTVPQMLAGSGGTHPGMLYHHGPRT
ncbi:polysaccharide deacetylase family protein [Streptomyces olivaceoviridis]